MNRSSRQHAGLGEVLLVVALKLLIILLLWWCFFSPEQRPTVTPSGMNDVLLGTGGSVPSPASTEATSTGSQQ